MLIFIVKENDFMINRVKKFMDVLICEAWP